MTARQIPFRVHFNDGTHWDASASSAAAARSAAQRKLDSESSAALITKIKVLKTERA